MLHLRSIGEHLLTIVSALIFCTSTLSVIVAAAPFPEFLDEPRTVVRPCDDEIVDKTRDFRYTSKHTVQKSCITQLPLRSNDRADLLRNFVQLQLLVGFGQIELRKHQATSQFSKNFDLGEWISVRFYVEVDSLLEISAGPDGTVSIEHRDDGRCVQCTPNCSISLLSWASSERTELCKPS